MASTYLTKTLTTPTSDKIFTFSAWVKRSALGSEGYVFTIGSNGGSSPSHYYSIRYANEKIYVQRSGTGQLITNAVYRDLSAWYHIVLTNDTTQATDSNRIKLYVNGELASLGTATYPSQNTILDGINGARCALGLTYSGTGNYFDGLMTHIHFIDGTAYDADTFGETDATTGIWKPKTAPSVTYGTNGFFLKGENSGALGTDSSGEGNDFVVNGTPTQTVDTPSNVFCVLNPLQSIAHPSYTNGNTKCGSSSDNDRAIGTIPSQSGYYEVKLVQAPVGGSGSGLIWGVYDVSNNPALTLASQRWFKTNYGYDTHYATINFGEGNSWENQTTGLTASAGDILMMAWKNGKLYAGYNGTWFFGANPSTDTDGSVQMLLADANAYQAPLGRSNLSGLTNAEFNFGNGFFGTTAVTTNSGSGYSDSNGEGIFNYQPPTGTYACCTKNLNT